MLGCGQLLDESIFGVPPLGCFNLHPSDLAKGEGVGGNPVDHLLAGGEEGEGGGEGGEGGRAPATTKWTLHHVTTELDNGPIVGQSDPVCVSISGKSSPGFEDKRLVLSKVHVSVPWIVKRLCDALVEQKNSNPGERVEKIDFHEERVAEVSMEVIPAGAEQGSLVGIGKQFTEKLNIWDL
jgi:folate-dependent phosphoribosylglycinamide formyltransferase PurN